ncbi:DinB family protein [Marinactinospora rubrisoli]|uniref:DinB family protein n=1 Tax=Marinactinospora rubrisoli TaxID=2715399 RepID=A0ABW2KCF1_9ACTN
MSDRPLPPTIADERTMLEGWLEFQRGTLAMKCAGLDDAQLREAAVPPSRITLLGLVRHMAEVERNWFRRILLGVEIAPIHGRDLSGIDGGFDLAGADGIDEALAVWRAEIAVGAENAAKLSLDDTVPLPELGADISLRWIYLHLIEEYARHNGHADLIRERIDGRTGV